MEKASPMFLLRTGLWVRIMFLMVLYLRDFLEIIGYLDQPGSTQFKQILEIYQKLIWFEGHYIIQNKICNGFLLNWSEYGDNTLNFIWISNKIAPFEGMELYLEFLQNVCFFF